MTEQEWLAGKDSRPMAALVTQSARATSRVRRLFMAAFWGGQIPYINAEHHAEFLKVIAALENWAETGKAPRKRYTNVFMASDPIDAWDRTIGVSTQSGSGFATAGARQSAFLREIFGNPFRPVECAPSWLTLDVVALAQGIYADRAFDRMPILADALQDAGCMNEDVLSHCRDAALTHARGCWVVDLLLGTGERLPKTPDRKPRRRKS
jgi:hypothetical protein